MKSKIIVTTVLALGLVLAACGGGDSKETKQAKTVLDVLNADGNKYTRIKDDSRINGYAVFLGPDGKYIALKTSAYVEGMTRDQFLAAATVYSGLSKSTDYYEKYGLMHTSYYTDDYCPISRGDTNFSCTSSTDSMGRINYYNVTRYDYGYYTVAEDVYTDRNSRLVFEMGDTSAKDLEAVAATLEENSNSVLSSTLVSSFGLSEDRASEVASLARSWKNISKTRTMTSKDLVEFQVKVFGADLAAIAKAGKKAAEGDSKDYNGLIVKAAALNDMSPEQAKAILESFTN